MDSNKKILISVDLIEAYKITLKEFKEELAQMNAMWFSLIRLLITLSTSILLVSIGLIDKVFPLAEAPLFIRNILVSGWVLFFLSIIFGILTEVKGVEFRGKVLKKYEPILKDHLQQISEGQFGRKEIDLSQDFVEYPPLFWGLSEIVTFIFGVLCLSLYSIGNICVLSVWYVIAIVVVVIIIVGGLIIRYFKNR